MKMQSQGISRRWKNTRIPGESRGADLEMSKAKEMGKIIFNSFEEIPTIDSGHSGD